MGKQGIAPGKQNLRVTCPMGKVEFKYFSSPGYGILREPPTPRGPQIFFPSCP